MAAEADPSGSPAADTAPSGQWGWMPVGAGGRLARPRTTVRAYPPGLRQQPSAEAPVRTRARAAWG